MTNFALKILSLIKKRNLFHEILCYSECHLWCCYFMNYSLLTIHKVIPGLISSSIVLTWKVVVGRVSERGEREMLFFFFKEEKSNLQVLKGILNWRRADEWLSNCSVLVFRAAFLKLCLKTSWHSRTLRSFLYVNFIIFTILKINPDKFEM